MLCLRQRWLRLSIVLAAIMLPLSLFAPSVAQAQEDGFVPNEVVARLYNAADAPAIATQYGLTLIDQFGSRPIYRFGFTDPASPEDKAIQLLNDGRVQYAEPNFVGQTPEGRQKASWSVGGDAGEYKAQWAPGIMRLPEAHTSTTGAGVVVAVLDTGADLDHPELAGHWLRNGDAIVGYDFVDDDDDPREVGSKANLGYGHGTHVAGLVTLAAPDAKIMPLRVLDEDGAGNVWVLAEALAWAVDNGADATNLSLGTTRKTSLLEDIIGEITCDEEDDDGGGDDDGGDDDSCTANGGRGVVVVAAAGNGGGETPEYPAAEDQDGLLSVAASTEQDTLAPFSTRGGWVDLMAPGERILSTVPGGAYGTWSGTSMAAPLVAGEAALLRARCGSLPAVEIAKLVADFGADVGGPIPRRADALSSVQATAQQSCTHMQALPAVAR